MKKDRNIAGIILAVLCFLLAVYYMLQSVPYIRYAPTSRAVIVLCLAAAMCVFLGVLALARGKRVGLIIWTALNIIFGFYTSVVVVLCIAGQGFMSYVFMGLEPVKRWLAFRGAPRFFLIALFPMLILLILAICSHNRKTGRGRVFAKIICWLPGVVSTLMAACYLIVYFGLLIDVKPILISICRTNPIMLLGIGNPPAILVSLALVLFAAKDFLLGFWIAFPDRVPAGAAEGAPAQGEFVYVADESGRFGFCPVCGAPLPEGAMFCTVCGGSVDAPAEYCPSCGRRRSSPDSYCESCGAFMKTELPQESREEPQFAAEAAPTIIFGQRDFSGGDVGDVFSGGELPVIEAVSMEEPFVEPAPVEIPPVAEVGPVVEMPVIDAVSIEDPLAETAPAEPEPVVEMPVIEAVSVEGPLAEPAPVEIPPVEAVPVAEEPPVETSAPIVESAAPAAEPEPPVQGPVQAAPAAVQPASGPVCASCGAELAPGAAFCRHCGSRVEAPKPVQRFCAACGRPLKPNNKFCTACGTRAID